MPDETQRQTMSETRGTDASDDAFEALARARQLVADFTAAGRAPGVLGCALVHVGVQIWMAQVGGPLAGMLLLAIAGQVARGEYEAPPAPATSPTPATPRDRRLVN